MLSSSAVRRSTAAVRTLNKMAPRAAAFSGKAAAAPKASSEQKVVYVDGYRTPFKASQTTYNDLLAVDLSRMVLKGLMDKTMLDAKEVDYILWGNVIQEVTTSNIAREAAINAGIPNSVPANTIAQACISSNRAICDGAEKILAGKADVFIAGGVETFSDVPIRYSRPVRARLLKANKALKKGPAGALGLLKGLKAGDLAPVPPAIKNFTTGEVMGHSSDRLAARFGVTRQEMDEFAVRSHKNAAQAHAEGIYDQEIIPDQNGSREENLIRGDTSLEKMAKLKPAFIKPHGTHTAANSSALTDGAAVSLLMSEGKAKELGYTPKCSIKDWVFTGTDPFEDLLIGPTHAVDQVLRSSGLTFNDIDVFEIHEAFAGQVLANLAAMNSDKYAAEALPARGGKKVGEVPMEKLNVHGGSVSIGHPFGATGSRLVETAANRLIREDGKFALIAACADGGLAHACILERY